MHCRWFLRVVRGDAFCSFVLFCACAGTGDAIRAAVGIVFPGFFFEVNMQAVAGGNEPAERNKEVMDHLFLVPSPNSLQASRCKALNITRHVKEVEVDVVVFPVHLFIEFLELFEGISVIEGCHSEVLGGSVLFFTSNKGVRCVCAKQRLSSLLDGFMMMKRP